MQAKKKQDPTDRLRQWIALEIAGQDPRKALGDPVPAEHELQPFRVEVEVDYPPPGWNLIKTGDGEAKAMHHKHGFMGIVRSMAQLSSRVGGHVWMAWADHRKPRPRPRSFTELQHALAWLLLLRPEVH